MSSRCDSGILTRQGSPVRHQAPTGFDLIYYREVSLAKGNIIYLKIQVSEQLQLLAAIIILPYRMESLKWKAHKLLQLRNQLASNDTDVKLTPSGIIRCTIKAWYNLFHVRFTRMSRNLKLVAK